MATQILLVISLGHLALDMVSGAIPVLLPYWQELYGLSYTATGMLLLIGTVASAILQPTIGILGDRVRTSWLLIGGLALSTAAFAVALLVKNFWVLVAAIALQAVGSAAYHPEGSKATYLFGGNRRGAAMSIFQVGGNIGFGLSPAITTFLLGFGFLAPVLGYGILGAVVVALLAAVYGTIRARETAHRRTVQVQAGNGGEDRWGPLALLLGAVVLRTWVHMGVNAFVPLYFVSHLGRPAAFSGTLLSSYLLSGALGSLAGGPMADRVGRKPVILASLLVPPLLLALFPRVPDAWLFPLAAVAGFFVTSSFPVTIVYGQELLPGRLGTATGLIQGAAVGTGGFGVSLLGVVADHWGPPAVWPVLAALPLVAAFLVALIPKTSAAEAEAAGSPARQ